jgi:crotonobetainyl-CoA:carnitine CoA-transferase CaiB-like acyl-CoA transferase
MNETDALPPPLQGFRVVELGNYIAGPGTAMALGDLGAEVVKIESLEGDAARHTGPFGLAMLHAYNRDKRSVALDLRAPQGLDAARRLIARADVLVQNLRPGAPTRWAWAPRLCARQPALVHVSIAGFPAGSPSRDRPGYDIAAQAESGLMSVTGDPQGLPQKVGATIIDAATCRWRRRRAGRAAAAHAHRLGETIRISLLGGGAEPAAAELERLPGARRGAHAQRRRPAHGGAGGGHLSHPRRHGGGVGLCAGALAAAVRNHRRAAAGRRPALCHQRTAGGQPPGHEGGRGRAPGTPGHCECVDLLTRHNIVVGVVRSYADALHGEDFRASTMVIDALPGGGQPGYRSFGLPYELCGTPRRPSTAAPAHGAHTAQVLREAGFSPQEVHALVAAGVARLAAPVPRERA